tara:strand:- start:239 stop:1471 length:1233 start_codon:yes stop_codon:yes gene_type:complete
MGYIGNQANSNFSSISKQVISGNGGANYTLSTPVANANELEVFVNNVRQEPSVAYNVSGTALTMTGNVVSSDDFYVVYQGKAVQTTTPPDGSVGTAKIIDGSVTGVKLASGITKNVIINALSPISLDGSATGQTVALTGQYFDSAATAKFKKISDNSLVNATLSVADEQNATVATTTTFSGRTDYKLVYTNPNGNTFVPTTNIGIGIPTWNYNPMTSFAVQTGSWVNSSTVIAQDSQSYGTQGRALSGAGQTAISGVWKFDFQLNRTQTNSSPYPGFTVTLTYSTSLSELQTNRYAKSLVWLDFGNAYGTTFIVKKVDDNAVANVSIGSSTFGQAGCAYRITYDSRTGVFVVFAQANGNFDSMTQRATHTFSAADKAAWEAAHQNTEFGISVSGRGGTDGVRNVRWVSEI